MRKFYYEISHQQRDEDGHWVGKARWLLAGGPFDSFFEALTAAKAEGQYPYRVVNR